MLRACRSPIPTPGRVRRADARAGFEVEALYGDFGGDEFEALHGGPQEQAS